MSESKEITAGGREIAEHNSEDARGITIHQRLQLLREALTNPDVQPEKAIAMADLMFKLEDRDARAAFIAAKTNAINAMPTIGKNAEGNHKIRYADWPQTQKEITPTLKSFGLALNFRMGADNGKITCTPVLSGHGWEEEGGLIEASPDKGPGRNDVQAIVSTQLYLMRATARSMLNLRFYGLAEDDDGNAAGGTPIDPYDALTDEERAWVDEGREQAKEGMTGYLEWFKADKERAGFLVYNKGPNGKPWHQQNKECAEAVDGDQ